MWWLESKQPEYTQVRDHSIFVQCPESITHPVSCVPADFTFGAPFSLRDIDFEVFDRVEENERPKVVGRKEG